MICIERALWEPALRAIPPNGLPHVPVVLDADILELPLVAPPDLVDDEFALRNIA
jgi:hypothetical protein